jgi:flagellar hook-length control protein FliK
MALTVELQPDIGTLPAPPGVPRPGKDPGADLFGDLLASLGALEGQGEPAGPALPVPLVARRASSGAELPPGLDLASLPVPLAQPSHATQPAASGSPAAGSTATAAPATHEPVPAGATPTPVDAPPGAAAPAPAAPGLESLASTIQSEQTAGLPAAQPGAPSRAAAPPAAPGMPAAPPATTDLPAAPPGATSELAPEAAHQPDVGPAPPDGAPPPTHQGVVRTVGNAPPQPDLPPGVAVRVEQRPAGDRPLPRASEQAILQAAPNSAVAQLRDAAPAAPTAPAPPAPPAAEPPPSIQNFDSVATAVFEHVESGGGEARLHLEPADLGEIIIRLQARHDSVHVDIFAETPEAVGLLREAASDLSSLLGQRGMSLDGLSIELGARHDGSPDGRTDGQGPGQTPQPGEFAAILGIDDPAATSRHLRLRAAYNPDGALLFRV